MNTGWSTKTVRTRDTVWRTYQERQPIGTDMVIHNPGHAFSICRSANPLGWVGFLINLGRNACPWRIDKERNKRSNKSLSRKEEVTPFVTKSLNKKKTTSQPIYISLYRWLTHPTPCLFSQPIFVSLCK